MQAISSELQTRFEDYLRSKAIPDPLLCVIQPGRRF